MSPADVAKLTGVGRSTLNGWTIGEFKPYFSPSAQGGENRTRDFTEHDVRLIVLLRQLTIAHKSRDDIHAELRRLETDGWEDLPSMPTSQNSAVVPVMPVTTADEAVKSERRVYDQRVEGLETQLRKCEERVGEERARNDVLQQEIVELTGRLKEAELMNRLYESGRLNPGE